MTIVDHTTRADAARTTLAHRVSFIGAVRGELLKLVTVRSVLLTFLSTIPLGVLFAFIGKGNLVPGDDAVQNLSSLSSVQGSFILFAALIVAVASVLSVSSEYSTGQIGSTLTALPRRWTLVLAKSVALAGVSWVLGFVTALASGLLLLSAGGPLPGDALALITVTSACAGVAWAAVAVIALSLGGMLRSAAFAIAASFVLFFIAPIALAGLPNSMDVIRYLPNWAAASVITPHVTAASLHGAAVLGLWVLVGVVGWALTLRRRDI
ncbi:ABC transporter permease [Plantibacter sp. YIM 135249]|uniref:ABC transporter permease n=1 Tax=Plantibacter sp. YIM 135249 TaxID=3423918 RepID=UPI003D334AC8